MRYRTRSYVSEIIAVGSPLPLHPRLLRPQPKPEHGRNLFFALSNQFFWISPVPDMGLQILLIRSITPKCLYPFPILVLYCVHVEVPNRVRLHTAQWVFLFTSLHLFPPLLPLCWHLTSLLLPLPAVEAFSFITHAPPCGSIGMQVFSLPSSECTPH